jgi:hypothetical protein
MLKPRISVRCPLSHAPSGKERAARAMLMVMKALCTRGMIWGRNVCMVCAMSRCMLRASRCRLGATRLRNASAHDLGPAH